MGLIDTKLAYLGSGATANSHYTLSIGRKIGHVQTGLSYLTKNKYGLLSAIETIFSF